MNKENRKLAPFIEYAAESTTACLVTMVQGNLLALTVSHLVIASQTGIIAALLAGAGLMMAKTDKRWLISLVLGVITAIVDYFVHPGMFGPVMLEAIVTGLAAGLLSYIAGTAIHAIRTRHTARP